RDFDLLIETQITLPKETELERELFRNELKQISEAIEIAKGDLEGALIAIEQIEKRNMRLKKGN
ncbi:hypothetical protein KKE06_02265, partial [Candidatus Micrarchaeota archaeon]|nr:hypothetical protein [Candidatus Micrarchaeota archaeon]